MAKSRTVNKIFREIDEDHSGSISMDEFRAAIEHLGLTLTNAEWLKFSKKWDKDGNGRISYTVSSQQHHSFQVD